MGVRFKCHHCESSLNVKDAFAGRRGKCPSCGQSFRIPISDQDYSLDVLDAVASVDDRAEVGDSSIEEIPQSSRLTNEKLDEKVDGVPLPTEEFSRWLIRPPSGGQFGPATNETLSQWIHEKRVTANTLIQREGASLWTKAASVFPDRFPPLIEDSRTFASPSSTHEPQQEVSPAEANMFDSTPAYGTPGWLRLRKQRQRRQQIRLSILLIIVVLVLVALLVWVLFFRITIPDPAAK